MRKGQRRLKVVAIFLAVVAVVGAVPFLEDYQNKYLD